MTGLKRKHIPSEPGAYESLLIEDYLRAPGLSNSTLKLMRDGCPAKYRAEVDGQRECKQTPAMLVGTALHARLLDHETVYHTQPEDMSFATKEGKAWREYHNDLPILTEAQNDWIVAASNAVRKHPIAWPLIVGGRREVSMFATYRGRLMKGRADVFLPNRLVDIKTLADASDHAFSRAIADFGWHIQASLYWKLASILGFEVTECCLIGIEKPSNDTRGMRPLLNVKRLSLRSLEVGQHELDAMLDSLFECERTGVWPDYSGTELGEIDLPSWALPQDDPLLLTVGGKAAAI